MPIRSFCCCALIVVWILSLQVGGSCYTHSSGLLWKTGHGVGAKRKINQSINEVLPLLSFSEFFKSDRTLASCTSHFFDCHLSLRLPTAQRCSLRFSRLSFCWLRDQLLQRAHSSTGVRGAISVLLLEKLLSAISQFSRTDLLLVCTVCVCLNKHLKFFCLCSFMETSIFNSFRNVSGQGFFFYSTLIRNYYLAFNKVYKSWISDLCYKFKNKKMTFIF